MHPWGDCITWYYSESEWIRVSNNNNNNNKVSCHPHCLLWFRDGWVARDLNSNSNKLQQEPGRVPITTSRNKVCVDNDDDDTTSTYSSSSSLSSSSPQHVSSSSSSSSSSSKNDRNNWRNEIKGIEIEHIPLVLVDADDFVTDDDDDDDDDDDENDQYTQHRWIFASPSRSLLSSSLSRSLSSLSHYIHGHLPSSSLLMNPLWILFDG